MKENLAKTVSSLRLRVRPIVLGFNIALCAVLGSAISFGAAGDVDLTFDAGTFTNFTGSGISVKTIKQQADGKILIGGVFETIQGVQRWSIARLNSNGSLDSTFTSPFIYTTTQPQVSDIEILPDGKILVGGYLITQSGVKRMMRLNSDGTVDNTFNADPNNGGLDMVVQSDGSIIVIGASTGARKLDSNGALISSFATTSVSDVRALGVQSGGNVILAGDYNGFKSLSRWIPPGQADGQLDQSFNNPFGWFSADDYIFDITFQADGAVIASGKFSTIQNTSKSKIARFDANGTIDPNFTTQLSIGEVDDIKVQSDGKIVAVGRFFFSGDPTVYQASRFNSDGSLDNTFTRLVEQNGSDSVSSLTIQQDGKLLIGGTFTNVGGVSRQMIARLDVASAPQNQAPSLSSVAITPIITEGGTATLTGNIADPDVNDSFALTVNWGDGSIAQTFNYPAGTTSFSETHQYADNVASASVGLTLSDGKATDTDSASITVNNSAPALSNVTAAPSTISAGASTTVSGSISDAGVLDTQTVVINWGDGSSNTTLNLAAGSTSFSSGHQYNSAGSFSVSITITDDDGGSGNGGTGVTVNAVAQAPNAPSGLTATAVSKTRIDLAWADNSTNESGFKIERCNKGKNCTNFVEIAQVAAGTTTYQNTGLAGSTAYRYRVRAFNSTGNSGYTNIATAKTLKK